MLLFQKNQTKLITFEGDFDWTISEALMFWRNIEKEKRQQFKARFPKFRECFYFTALMTN